MYIWNGLSIRDSCLAKTTVGEFKTVSLMWGPKAGRRKNYPVSSFDLFLVHILTSFSVFRWSELENTRWPVLAVWWYTEWRTGRMNWHCLAKGRRSFKFHLNAIAAGSHENRSVPWCKYSRDWLFCGPAAVVWNPLVDWTESDNSHWRWGFWNLSE